LRIKGLYDDLRPGRPRSIDDEALAGLINTTLHIKPADGATHWSVRSAGDEVGISKSSVARYFKMFGLQPHRQESFKLSTDAFFIEKLRDVVGLYRKARGQAGAVRRREFSSPPHSIFRRNWDEISDAGCRHGKAGSGSHSCSCRHRSDPIQQKVLPRRVDRRVVRGRMSPRHRKLGPQSAGLSVPDH
jgi:hypothetical protein